MDIDREIQGWKIYCSWRRNRSDRRSRNDYASGRLCRAGSLDNYWYRSGTDLFSSQSVLSKNGFGIDDSLDVFAVHGVGGILGSLLLALFVSEGFGGLGYAEGMAFGSQFVAQLIGVGSVAIWSAVATLIIGLGISFILPMRVSEDDERDGPGYFQPWRAGLGSRLGRESFPAHIGKKRQSDQVSYGYRFE